MEIEDIDRQIAACKSSLFGAWLNSEEINSLEKKRAELIAEYNRLEEGK